MVEENGGLSLLKTQYRAKHGLLQDRSFAVNRSFEKMRGMCGVEELMWVRVTLAYATAHILCDHCVVPGIVLMERNRSHGAESFSWAGLVLLGPPATSEPFFFIFSLDWNLSCCFLGSTLLLRFPVGQSSPSLFV